VGVTIEDPTRLTKQHYTLGLCLVRLRGESEIADQDVGILMQVVMWTLPYARWKALEAIARKGKGAEETEDGQDFFRQRVKGSLGDRAGIPDAEASRINDILRFCPHCHEWRTRGRALHEGRLLQRASHCVECPTVRTGYKLRIVGPWNDSVRRTRRGLR
jgi:hypothetical protein